MTVVHIQIRLSLLGSYVCFTTSLDTVGVFLAETMYNLSVPYYCYGLRAGAPTD